MPRRRFRRAGNTTMNKRLGLSTWENSKPYFGWSKTLVTNTVGEGRNPGTIAGATFSLPVNNWNDPLGTLATLVAGAGGLRQDRHPAHHADAIRDGYENVQVHAWSADIDVNWILGANNTQDLLVAYTFAQDTTTPFVLTAGGTARTERMEVLTSSRWTKFRMNADPNPSTEHNRKRFKINVPNVFDYCKTISAGSTLAVFGNGAMSHSIRDVNSATTPPGVTLFCLVVIMTETGFALPVDSIHVTIQIRQKVTIMRDRQGPEGLDEGETDLHP